MPGGIRGAVARNHCLVELVSREPITVDNVQIVLKEIIDDLYQKFHSVDRPQQLLIKAITARLGHYLHKSWDKEKQEGVLRNPKASLALVEHFLKKHK